MGIQIIGNNGVVADVDGTTFRAQRVTIVPKDYGTLGSYRLAMATGTIAAALAANGELFQFRWTDATRFAMIRKIIVSGGANVAASAAAIVTLDATIARSFTVSGTGGAAATITGNNCKTRSSMGTTLLGEARISTTAALGAGTKTLDSHAVGNYTTGIGTGAITVSPSLPIFNNVELFNFDPGDHPVILAQNEGIVVKNGAVAWPAGMTWGLGVTIVWSELTSY